MWWDMQPASETNNIHLYAHAYLQGVSGSRPQNQQQFQGAARPEA